MTHPIDDELWFKLQTLTSWLGGQRPSLGTVITYLDSVRAAFEQTAVVGTEPDPARQAIERMAAMLVQQIAAAVVDDHCEYLQ